MSTSGSAARHVALVALAGAWAFGAGCAGAGNAVDAAPGAVDGGAIDAVGGAIDVPVIDAPSANDAPDVFVPDAPPPVDAPADTFVPPADVRVSPPDAPGRPDAGTAVTGSYIDKYTDSTGTSDAPQDLTNVVSALIPDGAGGFRTIIGVGHADGTFSIPDVPAGVFYARVGGYVVVTTEHTLDLGKDIAGRASTLDAQSMDTNLSFDISNLGSSADYIFFSSLNDPDVALADENYGGTTGSFVDTRPWVNLPLIDASAGDTLDILDLTRDEANSIVYLHLGNRYQATPFTMVDGQTTNVTGAFTSLPLDHTSSVDWRRSQFDALRTQVNPHAVNDFPHFFQIATGPPAFPDHAIAYLAMFAFTLDTGTTDESYGEVKYSDPYPAGWPIYNDAESDFAVGYTANGAANSLLLTAQIVSASNVDANPGVPVVPLVGPALTPKIAGNDAFTSQSGTGLTPVISWTPPSTGTASGYTVYVCELDVSGADTIYECVAEFITTETSIQVLPNMLSAGNTYFAIIIANYLPNLSFAQSPFRFSLPFAKADVYTATFTP